MPLVATSDTFVAVQQTKLRFRNIEQHTGGSTASYLTESGLPGPVDARFAEFDDRSVGVRAP